MSFLLERNEAEIMSPEKKKELKNKFKKKVLAKKIAITVGVLVGAYVIGFGVYLNNKMQNNNSNLADAFILPAKNASYGKAHVSTNDPNPKIDYSKVPNAIRNKYLHIDSYTLKNKNQYFTDSLLERYSYFKQGNSNYINSYIGSHGIISPCDPITLSIKQSVLGGSTYATRTALSQNYKFSDWGADLDPIIDYANELRSYSAYHKLFNTHNSTVIKGLTPDDHYENNEGNDDFENTYFSKNFAPNETKSLDYFNNSVAASDWDFGLRDNLVESYEEHHEGLMYAHAELGNDNGDPREDTYFFDGFKMTRPSLPKDTTTVFWGKQLRARKLYNHSHQNVAYSNGNVYFLEQMYKNYKAMSNGDATTKKLNNNYHLIDVYKKGWHLDPIMFNDFVRQPNKYSSPYQFNYVENSKTIWQVYDPDSQAMTNYLESQNYNLPCNYDKDHYYYRTLEGTLVRDDNVKYVNSNIKPMIMGDIHSDRPMPKNGNEQGYYNSQLEYDYATKYGFFASDASQYLNYKRTDGGFEPLWMVGLVNDDTIGTYHPGEIVKFNDHLSSKKISNYYIDDNGVKKYIPTYRVKGYDCFKCIVTFKGATRNYARAQDAYMLMGDKIMKER